MTKIGDEIWFNRWINRSRKLDVVQVLGSRREFSPFVNQLGKMAYGLTIYIDQSIYESTSLYINSSYDWLEHIRKIVTYLAITHRRRPSPSPIAVACCRYPPQSPTDPYCHLLIPLVDSGEALRISDPIIL